MLDNYINNFETITSSFVYDGFKLILNVAVILLIISLVMLIIGCLIKSQKIKDKFLVIVPSLIFGIIFILLIPYLFTYFKNLS